MDTEAIVALLKLVFYAVTFGITVHIAMIGYHWYSYTTNRTLAHVIVGSYVLIALVTLGTMFGIAFIN